VGGFGTGGYGTVYRVKRKGDGQLFAIKCNLPPSVLPSLSPSCTCFKHMKELPLLLLHTCKPIGSVFYQVLHAVLYSIFLFLTSYCFRFLRFPLMSIATINAIYLRCKKATERKLDG
jgi:hypothetical protein